MTYEELLNCYGDLHIMETDLKGVDGLDGLYYNGGIAIEKSLTHVEKACVLAEEIGHHYTTVGNILNLSKTENRKQERKARVWAYNKQIGLIGIVKAFNNKCENIYEMASFLDVTEEFLQEALLYYKSKYGTNISIDNYIIYFEPNLGVVKII